MIDQPLFHTICSEGCNGTGYVDDPAHEPESGYVIPCACNPDGRAHYNPDRCEDFLLPRGA